MGRTLRDIELYRHQRRLDGRQPVRTRTHSHRRGRIRSTPSPTKGLSETHHSQGIDRARANSSTSWRTATTCWNPTPSNAATNAASQTGRFRVLRRRASGRRPPAPHGSTTGVQKISGTEVDGTRPATQDAFALHCYRASACPEFLSAPPTCAGWDCATRGCSTRRRTLHPATLPPGRASGGIERSFFKRTRDSIMGRGFSRRNLEGYTTRPARTQPLCRAARRLPALYTHNDPNTAPRDVQRLGTPAGARWKLAWDALRHYRASTAAPWRRCCSRTAKKKTGNECQAGNGFGRILPLDRKKYAGIVVTLG